MKHVVACLALLLTALTAPAQSDDWQQPFFDWFEAEAIEQSGQSEALSADLLEQLQDLADHKLNLNQLSRDDLEALPFLSAQQVEALLAYVYRYAPVRSLAELQMVPELDADTRNLLAHFLYVGPEPDQPAPTSLHDLVSHARQSLTATLKVPLYQRQGDRNGYLGYPYRHDLRYQLNAHDRLRLGLTAAQDAGEPFFSPPNSLGYDHYALYLSLRSFGRLQALCLGSYRVQLGMGLLVNNGFRLGKLSTLQSLGRGQHTLSPHASRTAANHLQGAAATVGLAPRLSLTAFASYQALDATLNADGTARTLLSDGYHRTPAEVERRHNTHALDLGTSLGWRRGALAAHANLLFTHFDRRISPQATTPSTAYRQHTLHGNDFLHASLDYSLTRPVVSFAGETALSRTGALAMLHTLSLHPSTSLSFLLLHRYYGPTYAAFRANSFSENTTVHNEHGLYLGLTYQPHHRFLMQGYIDYAHFPEPRYQVSLPSDALDMLLRARVYIIRCTLEARYRFHLRQRDNDDHTLLQNRIDHRARLALTIAPSAGLTLQTQADAVAASSLGLMLSQQAACQYRSLQLCATVGWFHTGDYESRIYRYERSVLHDFSFPAFYGHGLRYALQARIDVPASRFAFLPPSLRTTAIVKMGTTDYFDRSHISSGLQQVDASALTDLLFQLRLQF